jgi:hypothetical protein
VYQQFNQSHKGARFEAMVPPTGDDLHVYAPSPLDSLVGPESQL